MSQNNKPKLPAYAGGKFSNSAQQRSDFYTALNTISGGSSVAKKNEAPIPDNISGEQISVPLAPTSTHPGVVTSTSLPPRDKEVPNPTVAASAKVSRDDHASAQEQPEQPTDPDIPHVNTGIFNEPDLVSDEEDEPEKGKETAKIKGPYKDDDFNVIYNYFLDLLGIDFAAFLKYSEPELNEMILSIQPLFQFEASEIDKDMLHYLKMRSDYFVVVIFMLMVIAMGRNLVIGWSQSALFFIAGFFKWDNPGIVKYLKHCKHQSDEYVQKFTAHYKEIEEYGPLVDFFAIDVPTDELDALSIKSSLIDFKSGANTDVNILVCKTLINTIPALKAEFERSTTPSLAGSRPASPVSPTVTLKVPTVAPQSPKPRVSSPTPTYVPKQVMKTVVVEKTSSDEQSQLAQVLAGQLLLDEKLALHLSKAKTDKRCTDYEYTQAQYTLDEPSDDEEFLAKYGQNCVYAAGTVDTELIEAPITAPSTIIGVMSGIVNSSYGNYTIIDDEVEKGRKTGNRVSLPDEKPPYRQVYLCDTTPALVLKENALGMFKIQATGRQDTGISVGVPEFVVLGLNSADTRKLTVSLQSIVPELSRYLAEGVVPLTLTDSSRYSMLSLFTRAWAIHTMLITCEEFNINPRFVGLRPDDITIIIANPAQNAVSEQVRSMTTCMQRGDTFLTTTEAAAQDLECMRLISAGTECVQTPADSKWELIGSNFMWDEPLHWAVLGSTNSQKPVPQNIHVTSSQLRAFIFRLANLLDRTEDVVNGYIRASVLMTGRVKVVNYKSGKRESFFINSMLEMYGTVLPQSWSDNPVWRLLRTQAQIPQGPSFISEMRHLHHQSPTYFGHLGVSIGQFISLGFSSVFHTLNLTGDNLTTVARQQANSVTTNLIQGLISARPRHLISVLSHCACGWYPQVSSISVNPQALITPRWSAFGVLAAAANPTVSWRRMFPERIPYIVQPTSVLYFGMKLESNWGLSLPGVKGEFKNELQQFDDQRHLMWNSSNGDSTYLNNARSEQPYHHVQYGAFALNTIMQECRDEVRVVRFVTLKRVNTSSITPLGSLPAQWHRFTLRIIPQIFTLFVGTLLTYDWTEEAVMPVALLLEEQSRVIYDMLETSSMTEFRKAGLRYQGVRTFTTLNTNVDDVLSFKRAKSSTTASSSGSTATGADRTMASEIKEIAKQAGKESEAKQDNAKSTALHIAQEAEAQVKADIPGAAGATPKA